METVMTPYIAQHDCLAAQRGTDSDRPEAGRVDAVHRRAKMVKREHEEELSKPRTAGTRAIPAAASLNFALRCVLT